MKTSIKIMFALLIVCTIQSCGNDDDNSRPAPPIQEEIEEEIEETPSLLGDWELASGHFVMENAQFLKINENFVNILFEDEAGFRDEDRGNFSFTETQMTVDLGYGGANIYNYTLTDTTLTLVSSAGDSVIFNRLFSTIDVDGWITDLSIISQGDAPWNEEADIAFNGTHILLGNGYETSTIGFINTSTLALDSQLITTESAFAVEVEKYDGTDRYIFQSDNGSSSFKAYREDTGTVAFTSINVGPWIYGIASVDSESAWVYSGNEDTLSLFDYSLGGSGTITETVAISRQIRGLDHQDDYLYICSRGNIYKCETSPEFKVVESIDIEGYHAYGIAYDGTNFWLNARSNDDGPNQIIKTNLTL